MTADSQYLAIERALARNLRAYVDAFRGRGVSWEVDAFEVTMSWPSGENAADSTVLRWPSSRRTSLPVERSHSRTVLSSVTRHLLRSALPATLGASVGQLNR